jgi:HSP20 family protein
MTSLTTYDPLRSLTSFSPFEEWDDLFRGFFVRPMTLESRMRWTPFRMDIIENDKEYRVLAEIPGVKKEDISVTVNGNEVSISAEVKNEKEAKEDTRVLHSERYYGKVQRTFTLEHEIDQANAVAKYADGVLELTLPKAAAANAKRLTVH